MKHLYLTFAIDNKRARALASELVDLTEHDECTLHFDSPGGEVSAAVSLYHAIRECDAHVTGLVGPGNARCESATLLPFLACDHRVARRSARFLLHPCSPEAAYSDLSYLPESGPACRSADWQFRYLVSERTGIDMDRLSKMIANETRLDGPSALHLGIAHVVVDDAHSPALNTQRQRPYVATGYRGAAAIVWR